MISHTKVRIEEICCHFIFGDHNLDMKTQRVNDDDDVQEEKKDFRFWDANQSSHLMKKTWSEFCKQEKKNMFTTDSRPNIKMNSICEPLIKKESTFKNITTIA